MRNIPLLVWALLGLGSLPVWADDAASQVRLGREKARPCTICHGLDGLRQGGEMPAIGGRQHDELLFQLGSFRRADRFHPAMTVLLQTYDEADMSDVAAYFASVDRDRRQRPNPYGLH